MDTCPQCGTSRSPDREYCPACGAPAARTPRVLQDAWQAYALRKRLGSLGVWSILWGVVAAGLGVATLDQSMLNVVLIAIGLFLIGSGIASRVAPGPLTLLLAAIGLSGVAAWNILVALLNGVSTQLIWLGVAALQIAWVVQYWRQYGGFVRVRHVPRAFAREVGALVDRTQQAHVGREQDVIEFRAPNRLWKARLMPDMVLAVVGLGAEQRAHFLSPGEIELQPTGQTDAWKWQRAAIRVGSRQWKGTVSPVSMARYAAWRATAGGEVPGRLGALM